MERVVEPNLIGESSVFLAAVTLLRRYSQCEANVLILGETGTGKELAARAIHYLGARSPGPFVPVNCGALPDSLVENELFGHVRGAFTDARATKKGLVDHARGGTLFLDEIESLSAKGQVALLRFLQDQTYRPVGGHEEIRADVRVIVASNRDLEVMVREGRFRDDLLYRLSILSVTMPALRYRGHDVLLLASHFVRRFAGQYCRQVTGIDELSANRLLSHGWPGNVRELENVVHREILLAESGCLSIPMLSPDCSTPQGHELPATDFHLELGYRRAKELLLSEFERAFVHHALVGSSGNVSAAARWAGKERRAFGKLLKKHGINRSGYLSAGRG